MRKNPYVCTRSLWSRFTKRTSIVLLSLVFRKELFLSILKKDVRYWNVLTVTFRNNNFQILLLKIHFFSHLLEIVFRYFFKSKYKMPPKFLDRLTQNLLAHNVLFLLICRKFDFIIMNLPTIYLIFIFKNKR